MCGIITGTSWTLVNDVIYFYANVSPDLGSPDGLYIGAPGQCCPWSIGDGGILCSGAGTICGMGDPMPPHFSGYQVMSPTFQVVWACAGICAPHLLNFFSAFDLPSCLQDWRLPPDVY